MLTYRKTLALMVCKLSRTVFQTGFKPVTISRTDFFPESGYTDCAACLFLHAACKKKMTKILFMLLVCGTLPCYDIPFDKHRKFTFEQG